MEEYETNYEAFYLLNFSEDLSYNEVIKVKEWREAIQTELNSLVKADRWSEVKLPKEGKTIDTKWIFHTKDNGIKKA